MGQKSNDYLFYDVNTLTLNTQQRVVVWVYPPQRMVLWKFLEGKGRNFDCINWGHSRSSGYKVLVTIFVYFLAVNCKIFRKTFFQFYVNFQTFKRIEWMHKVPYVCFRAQSQPLNNEFWVSSNEDPISCLLQWKTLELLDSTPQACTHRVAQTPHIHLTVMS